MSPYILLLLSLIAGSVYYWIMESSIPPESNCSFISSIWTDIIAFIFGGILIYKGMEYKDDFIILIGGALIVEHIWQLFPKFIIKSISI